MKCPKCGYVRQVSDEGPEWQCPACKVVYAKIFQAQEDEAKAKADAEEARRQERERQSPSALLLQREQEEYDAGERLWLAARGQKIVIYCIVLNLCLGILYAAQVVPMPDWAMTLLDLGIVLYAVSGILKVCTGLGKGHGQKILFIVLAFLPLIGLIALVYLSVQTTKMLRAAGWEVGLLGAKL